jgi:hypothetical protein
MLLSEKIAYNLSEAIKDGFFAPGEQLPPEMELSEKLSVSRATLREAIKFLESMNVVEVRRGIGTFVSQVPGLSDDALGLRFVDRFGQRYEVIKWVTQVHLDVLKRCEVQRRRPSHQPISESAALDEIVTDFFAFLEKMALSVEIPITYRLLLTFHRAFFEAFELKNDSVKATVFNDYKEFCEALEAGDYTAAGNSHAELMQMLVIAASEEE